MSPWTEHDTNWPSVLQVPMKTLDDVVAWAANTAVPPPARMAARRAAPGRIRILIWRTFRPLAAPDSRLAIIGPFTASTESRVIPNAWVVNHTPRMG